MHFKDCSCSTANWSLNKEIQACWRLSAAFHNSRAALDRFLRRKKSSRHCNNDPFFNIRIQSQNMMNQMNALWHIRLLLHYCICRTEKAVNSCKTVVNFKLPIRCIIPKHNLNNLPFAIGMKSRRIDWAKMTLYSAEFFFEYQMEESSVKFSHSSWRGCYIHSLLTTSKHHLKKYDRISVSQATSSKRLNRWTKRSTKQKTRREKQFAS